MRTDSRLRGGFERFRGICDRYWVVSVTTPRMAPRNASDRQPPSAEGAVRSHSFNGERRAGWSEAACSRGPRRDARLIQADHSNQESPDQNPSIALWTSLSRSSNPTPYAALRARINTSPGRPLSSKRGRTSVRTISLRRRLSRFRSTICRPCFGTITPNREREAGEDVKKTSINRVLFRFPRSNNARISLLCRMRALRGRRAARSDD